MGIAQSAFDFVSGVAKEAKTLLATNPFKEELPYADVTALTYLLVLSPWVGPC